MISILYVAMAAAMKNRAVPIKPLKPNQCINGIIESGVQTINRTSRRVQAFNCFISNSLSNGSPPFL